MANNEKNKVGTRIGLRTWLLKQLGMTYTHYKRQKAEQRRVWYGQYQRGERLNVAPVAAPVATEAA